MFIILEGGDYVGKSTIASALQAKLTRHRDSTHGAGPYYHGGVVVGHYGPPAKDPVLEYTADVEWYRPGGPIGMIWDRFHLGGPIYGPMYRPATDRGGFGEMGPAGYHWTELFLASRGAVTFLVRQDEAVIRERFEELGADSYTGQLDKVLEVAKRYDRFFNAPVTQPLTYAGTIGKHFSNPLTRKEWVDEVTDEIIAKASQAALEASSLTPFKSYVGSPRPDALLLGEKRHRGDDSIMDSAFMPLRGKSGEYLLEALPTNMWKTVGIANAMEEDLSKLHAALGYPHVVALGSAAARACDKADIAASHVPHPQYVRRFNFKQKEPYGRLVAEAAANPPKDYTPWP